MRLSMMLPVVSVPFLMCERGEVGSDTGQGEEDQRDDGETGHDCRTGQR